VTAHHRFIIDLSLGHMQYIEQQILRLDEEIARHLEPYQKQFQLLQTIPGIGPNASAAVLAEIGPDVSPFDDDGKLASWSGICPGNNESGGKKFSSNTRKGNPHLVSTLVESAWASTPLEKLPVQKPLLSSSLAARSPARHRGCCACVVANDLLCPQNR